MSLRDHVLGVKRAWKPILVLVLLGMIAGAVLTWAVPPKYVSTVRFFVASAVDSEDPDELFDRNQIATQRVKSYVELIRSDRTTVAVLEELGSDAVPFDDDSDVMAVALLDTVIIDVQVRGGSPEEARTLAAAYAAAAPGVVAEVESAGGVKSAQVALSVIEEADAGARETPTPAAGVFFGALLGLVLGAGGVVLWNAVRREKSAPAVSDA